MKWSKISDVRNDWNIVWRMARAEVLGQHPRATFTDGREPLHRAAITCLRTRILESESDMERERRTR